MQRKKEFYDYFIGLRQGNIVINGVLRTEPRVGKIWECRCDCGKTFEASTSNISHSQITDCPECARKRRREECVAQLSKHGHCKEPLHNVWWSMISRCRYQGDTNYKHYGGRGIHVCQQWQDDYMNFRNWALENGYKPGLTLDRINNDGNYEPQNCRWVSMKEQCRNRRSNHLITVNGKTQCISDWAEDIGVGRHSIYETQHRGRDLVEYIQERLEVKNENNRRNQGGND